MKIKWRRRYICIYIDNSYDFKALFSQKMKVAAWLISFIFMEYRV